MRRLMSYLLLAALVAYAAVCGFLYFRQESLLFYPQQLPAGYQFRFPGTYAEYPVVVADGTRLSGLLFLASGRCRGLVFFLHGNGGSLAGWGGLAASYTRLGYDVFMLDYRGYGKSKGHIRSQEQLLGDVEAAYRQVAAGYPASTIVVAGYSLGTGPATWLAARQSPRLLLLHAPYFSLLDMAAHTVPIWPVLPGWLLRYPMPTNEFMQQVKVPVALVHGTRDAVIPYNSSVRLAALPGLSCRLVTIVGGQHENLVESPQYQQLLPALLQGTAKAE